MPFIVPVLAAIGGGSALAGGALVASTGLGLYGASKNASAVKKAAAAQSASYDAATDENRRQFDITQGNLQPWLSAGRSALDMQSVLLGLGHVLGPGGGAPASATTPNYGAYVQNNPDLLAAFQREGAGRTIEQYGQQHWEMGGNAEGRTYTPFGDSTAPPVAGAGGGVGSASADQAAAIEQLKASPLYQSLFRNGQETVLQNASATGGLRGGNVQRSLADFGSDTLASVIEQQLSRLGGISGQGASTGTNLGQLGANSAAQNSSLLTQQGATQAGGVLGRAAAGNQGLQLLVNGIGRGIGNYQQYTAGAAPTGILPGGPMAGLF